MQQLSAEEQATLNRIRHLAAVNRANLSAGSEVLRWRHSSVAELLLEHGRLFTPSPSIGPPGPEKACFRNATERADMHSELYVEGFASTTAAAGLALEHAWCASGDVAIDPTWPDGVAYIGIPLTDTFREQRQLVSQHWALLWSPASMDLLRDGLPPSAIADVGRLIPSELRHGKPAIASGTSGSDDPEPGNS